METLKLLCQCLSPVENTELILAEIKSPQFTWEPVIYRSGQHLVTPALCFYLKQKEIFPFLNQEFQEYLELIYDLNLARNKKIEEQLLSLLPVFNSEGIEPLLLKGIASLLGELYESPGIRVLGDIDILVTEDKLQAVKNIMLEEGYSYTSTVLPHQDFIEEHHHLPAFIHKDWSVAIEIHRHPAPLRLSGWVNNKSAWGGNTQISLKTGFVRLPEPEFRLLHNFCHSQINDRGYFTGNINIRQLLEWVKLQDTFEQEFKWSEIQKRVEKCRSTSAWGGYFLAAESYFSQPIIAKTKLPFLAKLFMYRLQWGERYVWSWKINIIADRVMFYPSYIMSILVLNFQRGPRAFLKIIVFIFKRLFSLYWIKEKYKAFKANNSF